MKRTVECTKCGFSNPQGARFCGGCGNTIAVINCQSCGEDNQPGSRFCSFCGQSLAVEAKSDRAQESTQAERRLLTVMFCDLVDSTTIVDSLDPEETRSIIRDFQFHAKTIIEEFGGRITEYLGDGIVAQFTRHETNAERAISAGLELLAKLKQEGIKIGATEKTVKIRCGIATGLAVVGDMLGDARIRSESAIGLPLNLAARIQNLAKPSEIVIAGDTFRLTRGLFEFEDIGNHDLKGIKDSQKVWRVVKEKHVSSRFLAHTAEMTPMVDREDAMGVLLNCWESSKRGHADAVIFTGEAGIGKSRILQELEKKISVDDFFYLEYQCAPYHTNTALYPVINRLEAVASFEHGDDSVERLQKLEQFMHKSSAEFEREMPAFVSLMGLPEDKWPTPNFDPDEKKEWIFETLISNMFSLAKTKPVLIKIEDVHWIDPTTLELMSRMVKSLSGYNILLLITSRPGFDAEILTEAHVTRLEIERLPQQYTAQLIGGVKGVEALPQDVIDEIIQRTEGIPLFAEELSKSLMESMQHSGNSTESSMLAKKDIPTTLHDSLLSRLDRLPKASRSIAQLAAVIGRDFSFDLLEQVADYEDKNLYQVLTPLLESELVYQEKAPPYAEFYFKHALVRDVAYENLLQSERVDIHKKIAEAIEKNYPNIVNKSPELIARHFTEGKEYEKAVKYWLEAGKKASQQFALIEAKEHLTVGLKYLEKLEENNQVKTMRLEYLITIGPVLIALEGAGADVTRKIYLDAVDLCDELPESSLQFTALWGQWQVSMDYKDDNGTIWADRLQVLSEKLDDNDLMLQAHHCQWTTLFHQGNFEQAEHHINKGLKIYDPYKHMFHAQTYGGHDPRICGHAISSCILWFLGKYQESEAEIEAANQCAKELKHTGSQLHVVEWSLLLSQYKNDAVHIEKYTNELDEICTRTNLPEYMGKLLCTKGMVEVHKGKTENGISLMMEGIKEISQISTTEDVPLYMDYLARALMKVNRFDEALDYLNDQIEKLASFSIRYWHAEIYRCKGELLKQMGNYSGSLDCFNQSLELSENQKALSLKLRAAISLADLELLSGLDIDSKTILESIYSEFTAGQNSLELSKARKHLGLN